MKNLTGFTKKIVLNGLLFIASCFVAYFFLFLIHPNSKIQAYKFKENLNTSYEVTNSDTLWATSQLTITNKSQIAVLKNYELFIGNFSITNLQKIKSTIPVEIHWGKFRHTADNIWGLKFNFKNYKLKRNKKVLITFRYRIKNGLYKKGMLHVLYLPISYKKYTNSLVTIKIPSDLGQIYYLSNYNYDQTTSNPQEYLYVYDSEKFNKFIAIFGDEQQFTLFSRNQVNNTEGDHQYTWTYLPHNELSAYKIYFDSFDPISNKAELWQDNIKAYFLIPSQNDQSISIQWKAYLTKDLINQYKISLSEQEIQTLNQTKYKNLDLSNFKNQALQELLESQKLLGHENLVKETYNFIVSNAEIEEELVNTFYTKASNFSLNQLNNIIQDDKLVITNPLDSALVMAAILKANQIPVRLAYGLVYSYTVPYAKSYKVHLWLQYYDQNKEKWIDIDPFLGILEPNYQYYQGLEASHIPVYVWYDFENATNPILSGVELYPSTHRGESSIKTSLDCLKVDSSQTEDSSTFALLKKQTTKLNCTIENKSNMIVTLTNLDSTNKGLDIQYDQNQVENLILTPGLKQNSLVTLEYLPSLLKQEMDLTLIANFTDGEKEWKESFNYTIVDKGTKSLKNFTFLFILLIFVAGLIAINLVFKKLSKS